MSKIMYSSTRDKNKASVFPSVAIIKGIADDGGLFVPSYIPKIDLSFSELKNLDYKGLAGIILGKLFMDFSNEEIDYCVSNAYNSEKFGEDIVKIRTFDNASYLELFHGKTLAFKDMALSILPYLMTTAVKKNGLKEKILILTATSGDTGKAALEGFADVADIDIIVYYPKNGVSNIQELQMITQEGKNTKVIGINGNFDDAQGAVKQILSDENIKYELNKRGYIFSSANSINIGRLVPQIVYYFYSYARLLSNGVITDGDRINICVPTGNFGNILAAYYAKEMGLPVNKLICASNENNVLTDFFNSGIYNKNREFFTTNSPSMDILISSNLERLLYHLSGNDTKYVSDCMQALKTDGKYAVNDKIRASLNNFYADFASESEMKKEIKRVYDRYKYVIDPHTAVASCVYEKYRNKTSDNLHTIIASTASFYKFFRTVYESCFDGYDGKKDDFILIDEISKLTDTVVPDAVRLLKNKKILHNSVIDKDRIVKDFLTSITLPPRTLLT